MENTRESCKQSTFWKFILGVFIYLVLGYIALCRIGMTLDLIALTLFSVLVVVAILRFLFLLKTSLGDDYEIVNEECRRLFKKDSNDAGLIKKLIFYGYAATFFTFLLAITPAVLISSDGFLSSWGKKGAVGVLLACQAGRSELSLACSQNPEGEWVVNFGGRVEVVDSDDWKQLSQDTLTKLGEIDTCIGNPDVTAKEKCQRKYEELVDGLTKRSTAISKAEEKDKTASGQVNQIRGGIVVPLYMIIISLLGAAVGLARRLPEYQRRSSRIFFDIYVSRAKTGQLKPDNLKPMDASEVREAVVFQVLQVFSAPLVAITAYAMVGPEEAASVVLIAFASGFSTEAVLLLIRKGVDKVGKGEPKSEEVTSIYETVTVSPNVPADASASNRPSLSQRRKTAAEAASAAGEKLNGD